MTEEQMRSDDEALDRAELEELSRVALHAPVTLNELLLVLDAHVRLFRLACTTPTSLYIGHREWQLLKEVYAARPELYHNLQVVQVKAHDSYLKVGI